MRLGFACLDEKHNLLEGFEKIFIWKSLKRHYFCIYIFQKEFSKPFVNFLRVWTKNSNCWEILTKFRNFLMNILLKNWIFILFYFLFYFIFRKFVTKNRAFGNNISILQHFFGFEGIPPLPPVYALDRITLSRIIRKLESRTLSLLSLQTIERITILKGDLEIWQIFNTFLKKLHLFWNFLHILQSIKNFKNSREFPGFGE